MAKILNKHLIINVLMNVSFNRSEDKKVIKIKLKPSLNYK